MNKKPLISASDDIIFNLRVLAKEKEDVRRKLAVTAEKLAVTAEKLAVTAQEKEDVRRTLVVTAEKLRKSHKTLEKKVLERTKSLEIIGAKERAILLSIGDGLIATDEKGTVILMNAAAEKILGNRSKDVVGQSFFGMAPLEDKWGNSVAIDKHPVSLALKYGTTTTNTIYYNSLNDGTKIPVAITVTPVMLAGKVIGTIKVFRDITNEMAVDKAKTEFVSLASHQLRTPLSTVNWYAEMLLAGDVGMMNERQKKYMGEIYRSNSRMVELVNALLDVSRLELGTFSIEPESVDIISLAQSVIDEQMPDIRAKNIWFSCTNHKKVFRMQADPKLLRMVLQNILSNAIKYTPVGGTITASISQPDTHNVLLTVSDTGYGIPKNQQDRIFTKLFRADNVRDKDTDGTGLGLYIVKSIVENSGGKIWFKSPHEKNATTFYVLLPVRVPKRKKS